MTIPPWHGTRVLDALGIDDIVPLIDREALFAARWQFRQGMAAAVWDEAKRTQVIPAFERLLALCRARAIISPKLVYGYFSCVRQGNALLIESEGQRHRLEFPRERAAPNRCVADFFPGGVIAIMLATVGGGAGIEGGKLFAAHAYQDAFLLKGLAAEAAEATALYGHRHIQKELGVDEGCGDRFSPGFQSFPSLFAQRTLVSLLGSRRVGVSLTKTCHLTPEYSTTAIVSIDPNAAHFQP